MNQFSVKQFFYFSIFRKGEDSNNNKKRNRISFESSKFINYITKGYNDLLKAGDIINNMMILNKV